MTTYIKMKTYIKMILYIKSNVFFEGAILKCVFWESNFWQVFFEGAIYLELMVAN